MLMRQADEPLLNDRKKTNIVHITTEEKAVVVWKKLITRK